MSYITNFCDYAIPHAGRLVLYTPLETADLAPSVAHAHTVKCTVHGTPIHIHTSVPT